MSIQLKFRGRNITRSQDYIQRRRKIDKLKERIYYHKNYKGNRTDEKYAYLKELEVVHKLLRLRNEEVLL